MQGITGVPAVLPEDAPGSENWVRAEAYWRYGFLCGFQVVRCLTFAVDRERHKNKQKDAMKHKVEAVRTGL